MNWSSGKLCVRAREFRTQWDEMFDQIDELNKEIEQLRERLLKTKNKNNEDRE